MSENSERMKDQVRDSVEGAIDQLHRAADVITAPIAPIDGLIHGTMSGLLNWATDTHPTDRHPEKVDDPKNKKFHGCDGSATPTPIPGSQNFEGNKGIQGNDNDIKNNEVHIN